MRTTHYRIRIIPKVLHFKQPAGTSRGTYTIRKSWYLVLTTDEMPGRFGIGECAPLPKLSCDDLPDYEKKLATICHQTEQNGMPDTEALRSYPSILFGLGNGLSAISKQVILHFGIQTFHEVKQVSQSMA